ncbi:hypothetical protein PGQ11_012410 [Apiospora arundinis]|uniref:Uncharacterized protein n=1 Tax=Apiospora arundinis TaxID=335852 RepID=A0ABR2I2C0_9PEZI
MLHGYGKAFQAKYLSGPETKTDTVGNANDKAPLPEANGDGDSSKDNSIQEIRDRLEIIDSTLRGIRANMGQQQEVDVALRDIDRRLTEFHLAQTENTQMVVEFLGQLQTDLLSARGAKWDEILQDKLDAIWHALQTITSNTDPNHAAATAQGVQDEANYSNHRLGEIYEKRQEATFHDRFPESITTSFHPPPPYDYNDSQNDDGSKQREMDRDSKIDAILETLKEIAGRSGLISSSTSLPLDVGEPAEPVDQNLSFPTHPTGSQGNDFRGNNDVGNSYFLVW